MDFRFGVGKENMTVAEAKKAIALSRLINTDSEYNKGYNDGLSLAVLLRLKNI